MHNRLLFFLSLLVSTFFSRAQCDYTKPIFSVSAETDVVYGVQTSWNGRNDTLKIDIYKPIGDGNIKRPVIVMIHGGGFSGGNKRELKPLCEKYAAQGMVCISVGYRLGFIRPLSFDYPYALDPSEMLRAAYRGQQDAKAAIRFMKGRNMQDSTDDEQYYAVGFSAGAFIALSVGYTKDSIFKPSACNSISDGINLNGTFKRPDLGPINGNLNQNGKDANVQGVFNFFGAVFDTAVITENGPKLFQYHQNGDPIVPCGYNRPYHGMGLGIPDNYPYVMGSCLIDKRLKSLGMRAPENKSYIYIGNKHEVHDIAGYEKKMSEQLNDWICTSTSGTRSLSNNKTRFYPNPVLDVLHLDKMTSGVSLYSNSLVKIADLNVNGHMVDLSHLSSGIYFLEIQSDQKREWLRIVKQ